METVRIQHNPRQQPPHLWQSLNHL